MITVITVPKGPTLADVAALAGVSPATASRVFSGSANVSEQARAHVDEAVRRLGYVRRRRQGDVARPAGSIAAVIAQEGARVCGDPFFSRLLAGVGRELGGQRSWLVLIVNSPRDWRTAADHLHAGGAAGIILVGALPDSPVTFLRATVGVPIVTAGRSSAAIHLPYVDVDNHGGARLAVEHLLRSGRRIIGTIAGSGDISAGVDRLAGYRAALADAGRDTTGLVAYGDFRPVSGEHAMNRLLDHRPDIDAVLVASDPMAAGALRALRRAGRRVPGDVAVIGFDDAPLARTLHPRLTTVRQPVEELGARLVRELVARMGGHIRPERGVILDTTLILRESA
jgi:DNA-binding LacI/PurR family transcriptional regulator